MQDDVLKSHLAHAVVRLFRLVNRACNRALADLDLSAEQAHLLSMLWTLGPMTMGALQRTLALSSATLTGSIDRMEAQELVRRVPSPDDKRAWVVEARVPPKRRDKIEATVERAEKRCFSALAADERRELARLLDKCIVDLERDTQAR
ncbi:MAG TPA: MarR family transcriptional regulator [Kofleriaceae bacterium]|nr:MarR family transcriptional regulator [Kofleriaceae bacterium]